ncbi:MAG: apolipoprotein N-acyltransferase [Verrucomicrobiota bacterium]
MNTQFSLQAGRYARYGVAVLAGVLLSLAFPPVRMAGLAWLAPGLILFAALGCRSGPAFRVGFVAGVAHFSTSLYWLLYIPVNKFYPLLGWVAVSTYLALYPAAWVWVSWRIAPVRFQADESWVAAARRFAATSLLARGGWALSAAMLWVGLDMVRGWMLTGFPWNLLGMSQYELLPLIQIVSVTGVPGLSFLVAWGAVVLVMAAVVHGLNPAQRRLWLGDFLPVAVFGLGVWLWGAREIWRYPAAPASSLRVLMIQPSVPQTLIWDGRGNSNRFNHLLEFTELALRTRPDLLLWPEAAIPETLCYDEPTYRAVTNLARKYGVWMIVGSDHAEPKASGKEPDYFNSSFLVSPSGRLAARYDKQKLVIFGEYVPLVDWLPFVKMFTPISGGFARGKHPVPFAFTVPPRTNEASGTMGTPRRLVASVLICFEDVFADLARAAATEETDILVNLTNDGWFSQSAAQWQHAISALFRAVEVRRPLLRCTNNGLTTWVDPLGQMHELYPEDLEYQFGETFKAMTIPIPDAATRTPTFYQRHGDWFGWGCAIGGLLLVGVRRRFREAEPR